MFNFDNSYARLPEDFYSPVTPTPFTEGHFPICFNHHVARLLDLNVDQHDPAELTHALTGVTELPGSQPVAMLYAGHQFGSYVSQLGDGRAILLGQVRNQQNQLWDLHLKGAGVTPYSRSGDGRAVLRSSIREYLCGEAMHALGIPSTRSLCLIGTHGQVEREETEPGAMLVRVAPSHIRFGSFESFFYRKQFDEIKLLADYVIRHHFPELHQKKTPYIALLQAVIARTAKLIAQWQSVGFAHGVMNTDNMSILGITLDYGPFGFLDDYDPGFVCNHSDFQGRYAFGQQPQIAHWNLACLTQALLPLLEFEEARVCLEQFPKLFAHEFLELMRHKLGLQQTTSNDTRLLDELLDLLAKNRVDYTIFFRQLSFFRTEPSSDSNGLRNHFLDREGFDLWSGRYRDRLILENSSDEERAVAMRQVNPKYILRNYLAQQAIARAYAGDYSEIERLQNLLQRPFDEQAEMEHYANPPPEWAQSIEVSCSS